MSTINRQQRRQLQRRSKSSKASLVEYNQLSDQALATAFRVVARQHRREFRRALFNERREAFASLAGLSDYEVARATVAFMRRIGV